MSKYYLLKDIAEHKKGTAIEQSSWGDHPKFSTKSRSGFISQLSFYENELNKMVEQGYIAEVQQPQWTDDDMVEFAKYPKLRYCVPDAQVSTTATKMVYESIAETLIRFKRERCNANN